MLCRLNQRQLMNPLSAGTSVVVVHSSGGSESRPGFSCRIRRVVAKGPAAGLGLQACGGEPSGSCPTAGSSALILDLFYDERNLL